MAPPEQNYTALPMETETVAEEQRRRRRAKVRRWGIRTLITFVSLALVAVIAPPAVHGVKAWQARRHANKALRFLEQQDFEAARGEAFAAYQPMSAAFN